jgi:RHS repeat-associated protein
MTAICSRAVGAPQTDALYQGKDLTEDFDLDLYDFHARSYDPLTGRFLQIDPEGQFASGYTGIGNSWPNGVNLSLGSWHNNQSLPCVGAYRSTSRQS